MTLRVAVVSHTYVEPENRAKLFALANEDIEVTAYVPAAWHERHLGRRWTVEPETQGGVSIVPVRVTRLARTPAAARWQLRDLRAALRRRAYDVVHIEEEPWSLPAQAAVRAARRYGVASVLFTWQNLPHHPPWPLSAIARRTLNRTTAWVAGSRGAERLLRRVDARRPCLVQPQLGVAVPSTRPRAHPGEVLRIGYVGRLVPEKGIDDLLDAVTQLPAPWSLDIVGDGPDRARLAARAAQAPGSERVHFHGAIAHDAVNAIWNRLDVLVLPSRTTPRWAEQFGHVLVEAMARGVAVIGTDSGAIADVIGHAGTIVPERDPAALRDALAPLARDRGALEAARARAFAGAGAFAHERLAARLAEYWRSITPGGADANLALT